MNDNSLILTVRNESGVVIDEIDPEMNKTETEFTFSTSSSVNGFPTADIGVNLVKQFSGFNIIDKHFNIDANLRNTNLGSDRNMFSGTYLKKEISFSKEKGYGSVKIKFVHSFFKVTLLGLKKRQFDNVKFVDFFQDILKEAKVRSIVKNPEIIETIMINGIISEVNLFRFIKEICFRNGLVMIFDHDDTIRFEYRERILADRLTAVPIKITENDIISLKGIEGF